MAVALVTGASSGIGSAIARRYVTQGASVVLADIENEHGELLTADLQRAGGRVIFVHCDVADPDHHQHCVESALRAFGRLDIAVNNAGVAGIGAPTGSYPLSEWKRTIDINLSGVFYGLRAQIPVMVQQGAGAIVAVASILGSVGYMQAPAYCAAKHGVVGLVKAAALDHSHQGVRINVVGPAFINTPMIASIMQDEDATRQVVARHPIGRIGRPEEVASVVTFLTSDDASFITGSYIPIDGGYLAQ